LKNIKPFRAQRFGCAFAAAGQRPDNFAGGNSIAMGDNVNAVYSCLKVSNTKPLFSCGGIGPILLHSVSFLG
jgi:hypothetical protein